MFGIKFNSSMRWAWFFLSLMFLAVVLLRLISPNEPFVMKLVLVAICLVNPGILVYLVRAFRGPNRDWRDRSENAEPLSAWGYFWRAYIAFFGQTAVLLLVNVVIPANLHVDRFSAIAVLLWEIPFALASAIATWLLFSRDRLGQAKMLIASVRGY